MLIRSQKLVLLAPFLLVLLPFLVLPAPLGQRSIFTDRAAGSVLQRYDDIIIERIEYDRGALEVRIAHLEGAYEQVDTRLCVIGGDIRSLRSEIQEVGRNLDTIFRWVIGVILVNWITLMLAILLRR